MAVSGNGTVTPPEGDHSYVEGATVNITAVPDAGWQFDNWTGDVAESGSENTTVTMDSDKTVKGEQAYMILGTAPVEGRVSGIVDIPNACCTVAIPTEIFDFDIKPNASGPTKSIPSGVDAAACR